MKGKTGAVITVRMTSSRMPGKVLQPLAGMPALFRLVERIRFAKSLDDIVVATSTNAADDPIYDLCKANNIHCFRGSETDVLGRILGTAEAFDIDHILYICGDCPCADPFLVDELLAFYNSGHMDYASNCEEITYPIGQNLEVFSREAIRRLDGITRNPWDREHVTEYFYTHPEEFSCRFVKAPRSLERPNYRLCVDLPVDHEVINKIYEALYNQDKPFSTKEIVEFLDEHPEIVQMNQMLKYKKYRSAVIGLGRIGMQYDRETTDGVIRTHAAGYLKCSRTKLDALCDSSTAAAEQAKAYFGIDNIYTDMNEMLQLRESEIVSICTPNEFHAEQVIAAAVFPSVRAIFCEKPLALSSADVERILAVCEKRKIHLVVNYWMRFSQLYQNLKAHIDNGSFGPIQQVHYTYSKGLFNSGSHAINLMIYLFGRPLWVQAGCGYDVGTGDNNVDGMMCMSSGVMVHFSCCDWRHHFTTDQKIYGTEKMIWIGENGREVKLFCKGPNPIFPEFNELVHCQEQLFETGVGKPMLTAIDEIVALLDGERPSSTSPGRDELLTIRTIEALKTSLAQGGARIEIGG